VETQKIVKGMLWEQSIKVYTEHKNLTRDALGLTSSSRVYQWRLLLEECAPEIIFIEENQNTVMDAVSQLEYNPKLLNPTNDYTHDMLGVSTIKESMQRWKSFLHHWQIYNKSYTYMQTLCVPMNKVFANPSIEDESYPLTTAAIFVAQRANMALKHLFKRNAVLDRGSEIKLFENTTCLCKVD
jgi:hypothetical protein